MAGRTALTATPARGLPARAKALAAEIRARPVATLAWIAALYLALRLGDWLLGWAVLDATWRAADRRDCDPSGACWAFIAARLPQFVFGFYPEAERWRAVFAIAAPPALMALAALPRFPGRAWIVAGGFAAYPLVAALLLEGSLVGLTPVSTEKWGGLTLTMFVGAGAFILSFPVAILLALARTARLPVFRVVAAGFIEFWRGLPLVAILFMSVIMLPLFLPPGVAAPRLSLAMAGIVFYSAAYLAEVIRGGLNGVDGGQYEAAGAIGFGPVSTQTYIIMPQALRMVVPAIVNTAIALFKDTTYVMVVGLFDLLNIVVAGLSDPRWIGASAEGYVFVGAIFWAICFGMSRMSRRLERRRASPQTAPALLAEPTP